jgi:two-component system phosphate regulon response regulator OmpR
MGEAEPSFDDKTAHLLIVDDDRRLRALLQRYLTDNGFRVTVAADAQDARKLLANLAFDLIVLDVMMPGESGLDLTQNLRSASDVPILLLTARGTPQDRIVGLEHGADDYLPKPFEPRELVLRIQTILRRAQKPDAGQKPILKLGECRFDLERGELTRAGKPVRLTSTELQLLRLFATKPGEPFSRNDLCAMTGTGLERSVDVQVTRLRRKIESNPRVPIYLQTVRGVGYTLVPD